MIYLQVRHFSLLYVILLWRGCLGESALSALEGSSVQIRCTSSFPPVWTWFGPKDGQHKTLSASGTKPHPKLNDPRYSFIKTEDEYVIAIADLKLADAGKFVCDGDAYQTTLLSVVR